MSLWYSVWSTWSSWFQPCASTRPVCLELLLYSSNPKSVLHDYTTSPGVIDELRSGSAARCHSGRGGLDQTDWTAALKKEGCCFWFNICWTCADCISALQNPWDKTTMTTVVVFKGQPSWGWQESELWRSYLQSWRGKMSSKPETSPCQQDAWSSTRTPNNN